MRHALRASLRRVLGVAGGIDSATAEAPRPVGLGVRLALGLAGAACSLLLRSVLTPALGESEPFLPLFPLILLSTLLGGAWAGGACLIAGLVGAWYLFMGQPYSFRFAPYELGGLIGALVAGGVIVALCLELRRLLARARTAAEQERIVAREFAHRMRNTLTLVLALSRRSFAPERPLEAARADFEARVAALSAAHGALLDARGDGAELEQIAARTLAVFGYAPGDARFTVDGPAVRLGPDAATALALALHELCTNATKYGSLSTPGGRVELRWRLDGDDARELRLDWQESGGPAVSAPGRRGLGSRLIEQNLARTLGGTAILEFTPDGVRAQIAARLT
jgi:two-component sensor histidine kinase